MQFLCFFSFPSQASAIVLLRSQTTLKKLTSEAPGVIGAKAVDFDKIQRCSSDTKRQVVAFGLLIPISDETAARGMLSVTICN